MLSYLITFLYFAIPVAAVLFFAVCIYRYSYAKFQNKHHPGSYSPEQLKTRLILLIVSAVIFGVMAMVVVTFASLLLMAVVFM